ncbi:MAG TPA: fumarylacetoacetate hydrolase family protein [Roseiarcus sp.]|nr:fumarylacetoacetate hydrolase family protein [Roseiarcus sp.]
MEIAGVIEAAQTLMEEHEARLKFHSLAKAVPVANIDTAYAVQREYVRLQSLSRGAAPIGYKVGLTSPRMQAMCGVETPIAGVVLADRVYRSGVRLEGSDYGRLGLEFEVAVRLARDLGGDGRPVALTDVADAIDAVCPAMEIVDDRACDYASLDVFSLVADNSWNAEIVLGEFQRRWPDLAEIEDIISVNGAVADRGFGREVLGHPFHSVAWLAEHLSGNGTGFRAGDIVMTGNLVTTRFPAESCNCRFELARLGRVDLTVEV